MTMPTEWLVQHKPDQKLWVAAAMVVTSEGLRPVTPRIIGSGLTPQAALLRAIQPCRERHPSASEAAETLNRIRNRRRMSLATMASYLPVSADELKASLHNADKSPATYSDWASALSISDADFKLELRDVQRERDFAPHV